jgi:hypothetical protein
VDASLSVEAVQFLTKETEFVYAFYQAAELEVRATERYVLIGLGGMYSYLATRDLPAPFLRWRGTRQPSSPCSQPFAPWGSACDKQSCSDI